MRFKKPPSSNNAHIPATIALSIGLLLSSSAIAATNATHPNQSAPGIVGLWYTQDRDGVIDLYPCAEKICGRFHWLEKETEENGQPSRDDRNPDPELRARPLCGMTFMGDFAKESGDRYSDGWIYSPRSGSTYKARLTLSDSNTLLLHGYILTPFLGETQTWKRAVNPPICSESKTSQADSAQKQTPNKFRNEQLQ